MSVYTAVTGQNLYDVCLITYGSLDQLVKLANDNNIINLNNTSLSGIEFTYDNSLVVNQVLTQKLSSKYGTAAAGGNYYVTEDGLEIYTSDTGDSYVWS